MARKKIDLPIDHTTWHDEKTGVLIHEEFTTARRMWLHREGGPAVVTYNRLTGKKEAERWYCKNATHRDDGPARIKFCANSSAITEEEWYQHGRVRRLSYGPSKIQYDPVHGTAIVEEWRRYLKFHREDGPALILRDAVTGMVHHEEWCLNGVPHRVGGPAIIARCVERDITRFRYYARGRLKFAKEIPGLVFQNIALD